MAITRVSTQGLTRSGTAIADVPDSPVIGAISDPGTDGYATVAFTAAATGGTVTTYTATSTPGSITATSATSPITVTGLTLSTEYTFKVKGANSTATGAESAASSSFTPIAHWSPSGAYDSIATVTLGSGSTTVAFTSIPQTYTHLQLRMTATNGTTYQNTQMQLGATSLDTGANYAWHQLTGDGASAGAASGTSATFMYVGYTGTTSGAGIIDILDYTSTTKYKTVRALGGADGNGSGLIHLRSGLWMNTGAISYITLTNLSTYAANSSFALYGIKGA